MRYFALLLFATRVAAAQAPGMTVAVAAPPPPASPSPASPDTPENWFMVGAVTTPGLDANGVRIQDDLIAGTSWSLGVAIAFADAGDRVMGTTVPEAKALAYIAHTNPLIGPLHLRAQLGYGGALNANATDASVAAGSAVTATRALWEAALLLQAHLDTHWAVVGGPVLDLSQDPSNTTSWSVFAGLQHR